MTNDLQAAYVRSKLRLIGVTFEKAMRVPCLRMSLECAAKQKKRTQARNSKHNDLLKECSIG